MDHFEKCEYCEGRAIYTNSAPDPNSRGVNRNEPGYRRIFLCVPHAIMARTDSCSRVERIEGLPDDEFL